MLWSKIHNVTVHFGSSHTMQLQEYTTKWTVSVSETLWMEGREGRKWFYGYSRLPLIYISLSLSLFLSLSLWGNSLSLSLSLWGYSLLTCTYNNNKNTSMKIQRQKKKKKLLLCVKGEQSVFLSPWKTICNGVTLHSSSVILVWKGHLLLLHETSAFRNV